MPGDECERAQIRSCGRDRTTETKPNLLVDHVQRVTLARPHSGSAKKRAQGSDVTALAANHFAYVSLGDFEFDHVVIEMLDENLIRLIDDPLCNLLDEQAYVRRSFRHGMGYATEAAGAAAGLE
jgi:hypothetical protein